MFSYEILSDGQYHRVELLSIKKNFTLRVDGGLARSIVNEGDNEFLQVGDLPQLLIVHCLHVRLFAGAQVNVPGRSLGADWGTGSQVVAPEKRNQFQRLSQGGLFSLFLILFIASFHVILH